MFAGSAGTNLKSYPKEYEEITGTVIAYDQFSGICFTDIDIPRKLYLIVRVNASDEKQRLYLSPLMPPRTMKFYCKVEYDRRCLPHRLSILLTIACRVPFVSSLL